MQDSTPLRALRVTYHGPTNTLGARVRVQDLRGIIRRPLWIRFDHSMDSPRAMALEALRERGWSISHHAETPDGWVLLCSDWRRSDWTLGESPEPEPEPEARGLDSAVLAQAMERIHRLATRTVQGQDPEGFPDWETVAVHRLERILAITRPTLRAHLGRGQA